MKPASMCISRRHLVSATSLAFLMRPSGRLHAEAKSPFVALEDAHGGRLGVYVHDLGSDRILAYRADERFMLCSTFKGILAGLVLFDVDAGRISLTETIAYRANDLLPASPVTSSHVGQGALPVEELCRAILHISDNTAANLLLRRCGGPSRLTQFVRNLGDTITFFDRYELAAGERSGDLDTTTPRAIAETARRLLLGDVLSAVSRAALERWMVENQAGLHRLRAALPPTWIVADRTGTGDGLCNDYALARPPGRLPLVMSAYYDAPGMKIEQQEAVLREVGAAIAQWRSS